MTTRTYHVPAISCGHCKSSIESALGELDGVSRAEVDVAARSVTVDGEVDDETVTGALDEIGYEVSATS